MTRLRVAFVYDDTMDRYGGVAQYCLTMAQSLVARGHEVQLLVGDTSVPDVEGIPVRSLSRNLKVRFNGNALSIPLLTDQQEILAASRDSFDVLHVQMPYSPLLAGKLIARAGPRTAVVGTFHVASERWAARAGARGLAWWCRRTTDRFDSIIAVSAAAEDFARSAFKIAATCRVPNMTPIDGRPNTLPENPNPVIAFVGRLEERKGIEYLIRDFPRILDRFPEASLLIAGEGSLDRHLRRLVRDNQLADQVTFLGAIDPAARSLLLGTADVACFPSTFGESFGIVLIEAMSAGSGVVIGGDNAGHRAVLDSDPLVIADSKRPGELASKIVRLLADDELRRQVHDRQSALVKKYDADIVCERILNVYDEALTHRRGDHVRLRQGSQSRGRS